MRILQLGKFYPIRGGVEKVMRDLTEGISERGVRCDMLCAKLPSAPIDAKDTGKTRHEAGTLILQLNASGRIICVPALCKVAGTMISPAMIRYLKAHCQEYDIIHIHHPDPMAALSLCLSGYKGRVIVHWHSDIVSQKLLLLFYKPLQNWMLRRAERIVGTTPVYVRNSPHLRHSQSKCSVVPIGILPLPMKEADISRIRRSFMARYHILSVGRLVPYKGYQYLIEAMGYLPESFELQIVGEGPLRGRLEKLIRENHLEHRVSLPGYLPEGDEFNALFGACDLFVLPSVIKTEAFGIVQIEAMSCGKPVVATSIPGSGVSWVNEDGVSGMNVPPRNAKMLATAIQGVLDNQEKYSDGARRLFEARYTLGEMIKNVLKIYEK
ncbi:MAG: glycosyltransferase [Bacteroidales bacterium]|nr:glycosyltransferase [Bacteroidales bacterium]